MRTDFRLGEWLVQPELNRVRGSEGDVHLEPRVMDVLVYLARHAGEVLPKERIIQAVWSDTFVSDEVLSRAVKEIRKAFGDDAKDRKVLETIPRRGYRLLLPVAGIPDGASADDPTRAYPGAYESATTPSPPRRDSGRVGTAEARRTRALPAWAWGVLSAVGGIATGRPPWLPCRSHSAWRIPRGWRWMWMVASSWSRQAPGVFPALTSPLEK
jgi:DNA-binding winged helix-turn-helix (wHTH) protein